MPGLRLGLCHCGIWAERATHLVRLGVAEPECKVGGCPAQVGVEPGFEGRGEGTVNSLMRNRPKKAWYRCGRRWAEAAVDVRPVTKGLPRSGAAVGRPVWGDVAGETPHVHVRLQFVPVQSGVVGGYLAEQPIVPQAV